MVAGAEINAGFFTLNIPPHQCQTNGGLTKTVPSYKRAGSNLLIASLLPAIGEVIQQLYVSVNKSRKETRIRTDTGRDPLWRAGLVRY
jgi:hypothetical protein